MQIWWGSLYLGICAVMHVGALAGCVYTIRAINPFAQRRAMLVRVILILNVALLFIVVSHTVQVWFWAAHLISGDVLSGWNDAVYFSLVTYTTLGYGDIVLGPGQRLFTTFAAVTGLLNFGLSTAFLVALMSQMFRHDLHLDPGLEQGRE